MRENAEKITKEFCKGKTLIFYPKTEGEAAFIQRRLFEMGHRWVAVGLTGSNQDISRLSDCVEKGMVLSEAGNLYFAPGQPSMDRGYFCTAAQLDENYVAPLTPEQEREAEAVAAARLERLRQSRPQKLFPRKPPAGK